MDVVDKAQRESEDLRVGRSGKVRNAQSIAGARGMKPEGDPSYRWLYFCCATFLFSSTLRAHEDSLSFWMVQVQGDRAESTIMVSLLDLNFIPELDANQDGNLEHQEVSAQRDRIAQRLVGHFRLFNGQEEGKVEIADFRIPSTGELELSLRHEFSQSILDLRLTSTFHELTDIRHRTFCRLDYGGQMEQYLLDAREPSRQVAVLLGWDGLTRRMVRFLRLGVEHIFTGYDHMAFLLGLIILGGSLGALAGIVTSFTLAHSITLILATLNLVVLPDRFVEAAIALSICYIALENILVSEIRFRWVISFFFGLVHGFGFSNILRSMQLPRQGLMTSLLSFNLGVEVGQILIIAALFPLVLYVSRRQWHRSAVTVTSSLILGLGVFWLAQRLT